MKKKHPSGGVKKAALTMTAIIEIIALVRAVIELLTEVVRTFKKQCHRGAAVVAVAPFAGASFLHGHYSTMKIIFLVIVIVALIFALRHTLKKLKELD